jgi:hypothetical protein
MATLTLTDLQVIELIQQLPTDQQIKVFQFLLTQPWANWVYLSRYAQEGARQAATQRGKNWDAMTEEEREEFICEVINED